MRTTKLAPCAVLLSALLACAASATEVDSADRICTADPCTVSRRIVIAAGAVLDFSGRPLVITRSGALVWRDSLTIYAGGCDFQASSQIIESPASSGKGFLDLHCDASILAGKITTRGGGVVVSGTGPHFLDKSGVITARGPTAGIVALDADNPRGDIFVSGKITAQSQAGPAPYEVRLWSKAGNIVVDRDAIITTTGTTAQTDTNSLRLEADDGLIWANGEMHATAGSGGMWIAVEAKNDVVLGPAALIDAAANSTGPTIGVNSQLGNVTVQGKVVAPVTNFTVDSQQSAHVGLCAGGDILLDGATIDTSDGDAFGSIVLGAAGTAQVGTPEHPSTLRSMADGDIEVCSGSPPAVTQNSVFAPAPWRIGTNGCLSPGAFLNFFLPCSRDLWRGSPSAM